MFSLVVFYVYILFQSKVINTRVTKFMTVVYHNTQACFCIVLMFNATLGGPSWFIPWVRQKTFEGFFLLLVLYHFR